MSSRTIHVSMNADIFNRLIEKISSRLDWPACKKFRRPLRKLLRKDRLGTVSCDGRHCTLSPTPELWDIASEMGIEPRDLIADSL